MSRGARLSIQGLYQWDNTIFDELQLPELVDRDSLINTILVDFSDIEVLYPNSDVMKNVIGIWSTARLPVWEKLESTLHFDYNPIENYDRNEEWNDTNTRTNTINKNETRDLTSSNTSDENTSNNSDITEQITAYDSDELVTSGKTTSENTGNTTIDSTITDTGTVKNNDTENENTTNKRVGRAHGNIGVTTTQEMIEAERKCVMFNMIDVIKKEFADKFLIMVW